MAKDRTPDDGPREERRGRGLAQRQGRAHPATGQRRRTAAAVGAHRRRGGRRRLRRRGHRLRGRAGERRPTRARSSRSTRSPASRRRSTRRASTWARPSTYAESPPIGGEHDPVWADCTGTVYDVDIRHENAVHSLEHGAVWITYNPDQVSHADIDTLAELVDGESGRMLSPYVGPGLPRQPAVVGPPAEGRLGRRPADRAVRRLPDPQPRLPPRGRRQLRAPGVRRRPAAGRRGRGRRRRLSPAPPRATPA